MNVKRSIPAMSLLLLLVGFPQISETIYSPALPNIAHDLMTSPSLVQWTFSIYFIGFSIGVFVWGWGSDHIGRRLSMLLGILIYILASIFCALAHSIDWLLISRLAQGLGASCGSVLTQAIAREALDDKGRHQFFSMQGFVLAFSLSLGPFLGGYLTHWFDWRSNFLFLVLMGLSLILISYFKLPETRIKQKSNKRESGQLYSVFKKMITDKHLLASIWVVGAATGILFSYYAEGPFVFIRLIHLTPNQYGWLGIFIAIAALLGSLISKRLMQHFTIDKILFIGIIIGLISSFGLICVAFLASISSQNKIYSAVLIIAPMMGLIFSSFGFLLPAVLSHALLKYKYALGQAGALFGLGYYLLDALFTWIMGLINNGKVWPMSIYFFLLCISIAFAFYLGIKQKRVD